MTPDVGGACSSNVHDTMTLMTRDFFLIGPQEEDVVL